VPKHPFKDHPFVATVSARIGQLVGANDDPATALGLVVGLSGGPDSVALLLAATVAAKNSGAPLAAAHFHHRLRADQADGDADFCRDLCRQLGVRLFEDAGDPRPVARSRGLGLEEAARHLRHGFFRRLLAENPEFGFVATGHHRDDQVETVLMRLFRGTGPDGLRGILPVNGPIIHPLLQLGRDEILAFLEDCGQPWRVDASNLEGDNTRARIRRELLPLARGIFGPGSGEVPARLAELLGQDLEILEGITRTALADSRHPDFPEDLSVARLQLLEPGLAARVLRLWLDEGQLSGLERVHIDTVVAWLASGQSGTGLDLPGGLRLTRDFDRLARGYGSESRPALRNAGDFRILVSRNLAPAAGAGQDMAPGVGDPLDVSTWSLTCPADCLQGNLRVRHPQEGDRLRPFGLDGSKKLSDLLREHRIPRALRPGVLVVADEEGILWVIGLARAERTRLLPSNERTVTITVAERSEMPDRISEPRNDY